jgi:hypothetical protein
MRKGKIISGKMIEKPFMRIILSCYWFLIVWPVLSFADGPFSLNGYYKSFFVVFNLPGYKNPPAFIPDQPDIGAVNNRLRLKLFYHSSEWLAFSCAYDFSPRIQDPSLFRSQPIFVGIDPLEYRLSDFDSRLYPAEGENVGSFGIFHNLDRALVEFKTAPADIIIGRQVIAWGSARVLNPTEVIAPFAFQELDTEERIGVDAVRVRAPLSTLAEVDAGYVFGKKFQFEKSAFFIRAKFYTAKTDIALLLLGFRENLLAGFEVARSIGGAGFWLEGAYVFADLLQNSSTGKTNSYFRGTVGLDYGFSGKTYGFIEYHFNDAGAAQPEAYLKNFSKPAFTEGAVYLMGKHYLAPGLAYQITPLINFNGQALFNLADQSMFISPQVEYNLAQDIYVSAGIFMAVGKRPEFFAEDAVSSPLRFRSEFGGYPDIYFSAFRIYF